MYCIDVHIELHMYNLHGCVTGKDTCLVDTVKSRCDVKYPYPYINPLIPWGLEADMRVGLQKMIGARNVMILHRKHSGIKWTLLPTKSVSSPCH